MAHKVDYLKKLNMRFKIVATLVMLVTFAVGESWAEFKDFSAILNNGTGTMLLPSEYDADQTKVETFGIAVDSEGNCTRVAADDPSAVATVAGKYWNNHGMNGLVVTIPNVSGSLKITCGNCQYSNDRTVKDASGNVLKTIAHGSNCYVSDAANVTESIVYFGETPQTITINGGSYCAYIKVEKSDFIPAKYNVTYANSDAGVAGVVPVGVEYTEGDPALKTPKNFTLYKEGYTLTGWNDGSKTYAIGESFTPTANMTLTSVFTQNTKNLSDRTGTVTAKWDFQRNNGAPTLNYQNVADLIYVTQATVDGEVIDVKLDYSTKTGKVANANWGDWCQMNEGTTFTLPSCTGATFTIESYNATQNLTVNGVAATGNGNKTYSTTISAADATATVVIAKDGTYYRYLQMELPYVAPEPDPVDWKDIKMDFTGEGSFIREVTTMQWGAIDTGIAVAEDGSVSAVEKDADNSKATLTGSYHSTDNGVSGAKLVVSVTGSVKISIGCNNNGTKTWTVTDGNSAEVGSFSNAGTMYSSSNGSVAVAYYDGTATTLTINGPGTYTGYIAVEKIDPASVPCLVSYATSDEDVKGTLPTSSFVSKGTQITLPAKNYLLYKEGYTLTSWEDAAGNKYTAGQQITVNKDIKLSPIFTQNTVSLADRTEAVTLKWDAQRKNGCPEYTFGGNSKTLYFVTQATIDGETIDVAEVVTTASSNGCFRNGNWTDWCQVNGPATFVIPSCKGATVSFECYSNTANSRLNGEDVFAHDTKTPSATVAADGATATFTYGADASYFRYLQVVLPAARVAAPVITDNDGNVTITSATDGAAIYYTTDGTEPTNASTAYSGTFSLENSATVKAIAVKDGLTDSKIASKDVTVAEPEIEWRDIKMEFCGNNSFIRTVQTEQWGNINTGIAVAEDGTVSAVATDASNSRATLVTKYHGTQYGLANSLTLTVKVPGPVRISFGSSYYEGSVTISNGNGFSETIKSYIEPAKTVLYSPQNPQVVTCDYDGEAATLTIETSGDAYCPYLAIEEIHPVDPSDPGYIVVSDIDDLKAAITKVNKSNASATSERSTIFLKNGTYDFGNEVLTRITANNLSFIGESMEGVIIKTTALEEKLGTADLFQMTGQGNYFQDLTLQNALDYYGMGTGRAAVMNDQSTKTVYKNVRMLSYQDTYYSDRPQQKVYFEGGEIHGTVDYICGYGDVFFKDVKLVNESRSKDGNTGNCTITAQFRNQGSADKGYVFDGCTIETYSATFDFGRSWNYAKTVFLNTTVKSGSLIDTHWTLAGMNSAAEGYYEYNTKDEAGNALNPTNWTMTFTHSTGNNTINTQLDAAGAAAYSLANFFTDWTPNTLAAQVEATGITQDGAELTFPDGTYLVEKADGSYVEIVKGTSYTLPKENEEYTLRRANEMGGFGPKSEEFKFTSETQYPLTAKWNFTVDPYPVNAIQGKDDKLTSNVGEPLDLDVIATSGKLGNNGAWAQFNEGTILRVPVVSLQDEVTVVAYETTKASIAGTPMASKTETYTAQPEDVAKGYVEIKAEASTYLGSVSVTQYEPVTGVVMATWDWHNKIPESINVTIQNKIDNIAAEVSKGGSDINFTEEPKLHVDASKGKLAWRENSGKTYGADAQINAGTIVQIPVYGRGDIVTIVYRSTPQYTINGLPAPEEQTNTFVASNDDVTRGYIELKQTASGYLYSITLIHTKNISGRTIYTEISPANAGTVKQTPAGGVEDGTEVTLTATPKTGYQFKNWTDSANGDAVLGTELTYHTTVNSDLDIRANFEKMFTMSFNNTDKLASGTAPKDIISNAGKVSVPLNHSLYKDGYTLTGWTDGANTYVLGTEYTLTKDVTVTPVFTANTKKITDAKEATTIRWDFDRVRTGTDYNFGNGTAGIVVSQVTVAGQKIDVLMEKGGNKLDNRDDGVLSNANASGTQMNDNCTLTIPAVYGMKVTIKAAEMHDTRNGGDVFTRYNDGDIRTRIADGTPEASDDNLSAIYTYTGEEKTITINIHSENAATYGFFDWVEVEYPALASLNLTITPDENAIDKGTPAGEVAVAPAPHGNTGGNYTIGEEITFNASAGYAYSFDSWIGATPDGEIPTKATVTMNEDKAVTATFEKLPTYMLSILSGDKKQGKVDWETKHTEYAVGTEVTLTAQPALGYVFNGWYVGEILLSVENPYTYTTTDNDVIITGRFDLSMEKHDATFIHVDDAQIMGDYPSDVSQKAGLNLPKYHTLYKPGYTLTNWKDNTAFEREPGTPVTMTADMTFTPVFRVNSIQDRLEGRLETAELYWDFRTENFAQAMSYSTRNEFKYATRAYVKGGDGETHDFDVMMDINTGTRGKIDNTFSDEWCTIGRGTILTVPSCNGATIEMEIRNKVTNTTFAGSVPEISKVKYVGDEDFSDYNANDTRAIESYIYKKVYTGDAKTADIVIGSDYSYYRFLKVTLPSQITKHEVALVSTDWTNWDAAIDADGYSGGHNGASTLSAESEFTTHYSLEKKTLKVKEVTVNKGRYTDLFGSRDNLSGYLTFSDASGANAPKMIMGEFKNVTRIKLRQGTRVPYGSGIKVTVSGTPVGGAEVVEKVVSDDSRSSYPEWKEMDVNMNNCTIFFENLTSEETSRYAAYMYDLIIYGEANTTNSLMTLKRSVNDTEAGNVEVTPEHRIYPAIEDKDMLQYDNLTPITLTAKQNDGWEFVKWVEIDNDGNATDISTENPYNFTITENRNIQAVYKRAAFFTFTFGGYNYQGSVPSAQQVTPAGGFTVPYNRTLFKDETSTLVGWEMTQYDGITKHQFGTKAQADAPQTYKAGDSWYNENLMDINLSPIMKDNTVSLLDVDKEEGVKARWYFGLPNGAPELNVENKVSFTMTQAQVTEDEFIDLRMDIDALDGTGRGKGKVNNVGRWGDVLAQVNDKTLFTIPATKGMKLEIKASGEMSKTTLAGVTPTTTGNTATWIYTGNEDKATIDVYDGSYYEYIEATYYPRLSKPTIRMYNMDNTTIQLKISTTASDHTAKTYYSIDGSEPNILVTDPDGIIVFTQDGTSKTVRAITISDSRPDSEVESYMVAPYNTDRRTVMYLYNGKQPGYSINNDIMYRTLMFGGANSYGAVHESGCNVLAHDVSTPSYDVDATSDTRTYYANSNYIFVAPDGLIAAEAPLPGIADSEKTKIRRYIADLIANDHVVITPMTVVGKLLGYTPAAADLTDGIVTVPEGKDNLRMLDYVLMDKDNKVCVSWSGDIAVNDLTLNAAYMLANSVKTIVEHYSRTDKNQTDIVSPATAMTPAEELALLGTQTTANPQLRNQKITVFGRDMDATPEELADLVDGEMTIILPKLPGTPSVIAAEAWVNGAISTSDAGKVTVTKDPQNTLHSILTLTGNGQERVYNIYATLDSNKDELIFTNDGNNTDEQYWTNDVWKVAQANGFVSGNNADVFKFNVNNGDIITISGPANYAIKSIDFVGYHYTNGTAGEPSTLTYDFIGAPYENNPGNKITSDWKMYERDAVNGNLKAEFGLYSINSVSFKLNETAAEKKNGQAIGRFIVEYYLREATSMSLTATNCPNNAEKEHHGAMSLEFSSLMKEVGKDAGVTLTPKSGAAIPLAAAGNSQTLAFTYFGLEPGNYTLTIPFSALKDIDGNTYTGTESDAAKGKMTKSGDSYVVPIVIKAPTYERKTFDFIVNGIDHGTTWDGTFIEGINQIGGNTGDRKRMLFLNSKEKYFIEPNGTNFTDDNSCTKLTAKNISLIGESEKGVVIANNPTREGMSDTPTIEFKTKDCTDNYLQDLTIRDEYPYLGSTGRATAFYNVGVNTIMKNVRLESYQDTYYSSGTHTYAEDCTFMGVVDFVYGSGDHWYERCNILLRNRYGNNIVAPSTSPSEKWGFVFNNCTIDKEEGATMVTDRNWTLARPWQGSPAATFLNTKMNVVPNNVGYAYMSSTPLVIRFHEYGSKDKNGANLDLAQRSIAICGPAAGSDSPALTSEQAAKYDIHTVMGGDDGYDPQEHTRQIPKIESLYIDGQTLYWKDNREALCYFVYYLGDGAEPNTDDPILVANIAPEYSSEVGFNLFDKDYVFRGEEQFLHFADWYKDKYKSSEFTHGWFAIRAANQRGGLNEMSNIVEYHKVREYKARVTTGGKETGDDSGNVWSTIYLDFNAKAPQGVYAYALTDVTAFGGKDVTETTVYFKRVSNEVSVDHQDIVYKDMGYLLYGPGPEHSTHTSEYHFIETGHMNIVDGKEESRDDFMPSYLSGTIGTFKGTVSNMTGVVGETGERGWSSYYQDYTDVPVGYTTAYTLSTRTVEGTSYGLGFYKYQGSTFGHHKAYLDTDVVSQLLATHGIDATAIDEALSKGFNIVFSDVNDVVTRVIHVKGSEVSDVSDAVYNTLGQRVNPATMHKGQVYIINGKKIRY